MLPASTCGFAQLPLLLPLLLLPRTRCCLCSPRRYCRLLRCCSAVHALARLRAPALASYVRALTRRALTSRARSCRLRAFARCMLDFCLHSGQAAHRGCTFLAPHGLQAEPVSGLALGCYELPRPACHLLHRSCSCRCSCRVLPLANRHQSPRSPCSLAPAPLLAHPLLLQLPPRASLRIALGARARLAASSRLATCFSSGVSISARFPPGTAASRRRLWGPAQRLRGLARLRGPSRLRALARIWRLPRAYARLEGSCCLFGHPTRVRARAWLPLAS